MGIIENDPNNINCVFCGVPVAQVTHGLIVAYCEACGIESEINPFWLEQNDYRRFVSYGGDGMEKLPGFKEFWQQVTMESPIQAYVTDIKDVPR